MIEIWGEVQSTVLTKSFLNQKLVSFIIIKLLNLLTNLYLAKLNLLFNTMHILQSKHIKFDEKESEKLLSNLNISKAQLPKILSSDPCLGEGCEVGDIIKIERKKDNKINVYYRVVV